MLYFGKMKAVPLPSLFTQRAPERAPLSVLVSRQLREAIVSGKLAMGTQMPTEKELSVALGVSRPTVREALRILQAQGILSGGDSVSTARPRVSNEQTSSTAAQAIEAVIRLGNVPLADMIELRVTLEGAAVALAAERKDLAALAEARAALLIMSLRGVDVLQFRHADVAFHRALSVASGNAAFPLVMGALREAILAHLGGALQKTVDSARAMRALAKEHEAILVAVEHGQTKRSKELMSAHIRGFYTRETKS
jgi:GntR family transcriptional regulator, transcriptional repressor for pyruvate dehydrogenase complex